MRGYALRAAAIAGALVLLGGASVAIIGGMTGPSPTPADTVPLPGAGRTIAARLTNGFPVFVVHHPSGQISVLGAFSTHIQGELVAWCPEVRLFTELAHGATYDEWGRYLGGPAVGSMLGMGWRLSSAGGDLQVTGVIGPVGPSELGGLPRADWGSCSFVGH